MKSIINAVGGGNAIFQQKFQTFILVKLKTSITWIVVPNFDKS